MDPILEFMQFVEYPPARSVRHLLERVLLKARTLTGAEGGSVFIVQRKAKKAWLEAASIQNDALALKPADFILPVSPKSIAGYIAETGETVIIDDLYAIPEDRPYSFDSSFDSKIGYRSRSLLGFALKNYEDRVIGVVQLINRRDPENGDVIPFDESQAELIRAFNHVVGTAVERADMLERISDKNVKLRDRNRVLREHRARIQGLQAETEDAFMLSIRLLARAAEIHDEDTGNHIIRTNEYGYVLAEILGRPKAFCDEIRYSAQLHDVGKMSVNSAVLKKKGGLTPEERAEMDQHTVYGYQILCDSDRLQMAAEIALNHHEKWDGTGYPKGKKGEEIPLSARIVALADVYDALRAARSYKPAFSHAKTCEIILKGDDRMDPKGHFDPKLLEIFVNHHERMDEVWRQFTD